MDPAYHQFRVGSTGLTDAPESAIASSSLSSAMQMPTTQANDPTHAEQSSAVFGNGSRKVLYGAGDADEGYTLTFGSMAEFEAWRAKEEEENMVEFVRNDRHVSKSVPPRFKEHTKLVRPGNFLVSVGSFLTLTRCVLGIQNLVGASMSKSTRREIEKFPAAR